MGRLAIFIDGGYLTKVAMEVGAWVDHEKLSSRIKDAVAQNTAEPLDLIRTYYYDALPYQSAQPTEEESKRLSGKRKFFDALQMLPSYAVRQGRLAYHGEDAQGKPIFQQKGVDLMIGVDITLLAVKHQISHAAVISGDSDLLPAIDAAQHEGVVVWLAHGPQRSYARELWTRVDQRLPMDEEFMKQVARE